MAGQVVPKMKQKRKTLPGIGPRWPFWIVTTSLLVLGVYLLGQLRLTDIQIEGAKRLAHDRLLQMAGLQPGLLRWEYPARRIERLLQAEPWVKSVQAEWSGRRLTIRIQEREPVGLLSYFDHYLVVDGSGLVLEMIDSPAAERLPVISGVSVASALRGDTLTDQGLVSALAVLYWMAEPMRQQVSEAHVGPDRSLMLFMIGRTTVTWGEVPDGAQRVEAIRAKLNALADYWQQIATHKSTSCRVDLRVEGKVISSGCE